MRILIINPNSDPGMTATIEKAARGFAGDDFTVECLSTPGAPGFIDSYGDEMQAAPGMAELVGRHENQVDGFVVACMDDPNLDALKEMTAKPVVGTAEAAMKVASMIGHRFSIVATSRAGVANHDLLARKYHLQDALASVRFPPDTSATLDDEEQFYLAAKRAVEEDLAEVVVLGCAGLAEMAQRLATRLGVPVLDGVICGVMLASGMARAGISTSKVGRYQPRV